MRRLDAVDLDHGLHVGADVHEGDERLLLGPDLFGLLPLLRPQLGGALEQHVERIDRLDGTFQLGVDEPDVEQRRGIAGQLVGSLELDESARVLPLVEEAQTPVEALRRLLSGRRRERGRLGARTATDEHDADSERDERNETHHLRNGFSSMSPCSSARECLLAGACAGAPAPSVSAARTSPEA